MVDKASGTNISVYQESVEQVAATLETDLQYGLKADQVQARRDQFGINKLPEKKREPAWKRLLKQLQNLLIVVLIVAAVLAGALAEWLEVGVILAVVLVNVLIGFIQEGKAEKALHAIQGMLAEHCKVLRDGTKQRVNSEELVPGDLVALEPGDKVPADLRLVQVSQLAIQEAALTGESVAVDKQPEPLFGADTCNQVALAERTNMAYAGTLVTQGQGLGIVVATAANTELGRVNQMLANVEQLTTPLLRQMSQFARYLTLIIVLVGVLYSPWLQALFATQPLSFADGLICVAAGVLLFILLEIEKWLQRRYMAEPIGKGHDG